MQKSGFCVIAALILVLAGFTVAADKPNILVFLADDHGWADSSVYGSPQVKTPKMQSLAEQGMVFTHAFIASPSCGPSRAALLTGLMPARNGAEPNHKPPRLETLTMVKALKARGYEVAAFGKVAHGTGYLSAAGFDFFQNGQNEEIGEKVRAFLDKCDRSKPLCLMVGDHRPHVPWDAESIYDPDKVILPDYLIDTPQTREHWARYLTEITGMDSLMASVDRMAREHFGSEDYLFLYTSDHGGQWPFGKWNLYDTGTRTPLIARWPGKIKAGMRTDAMVSWIDIMPTLIEFAGGTVPEGIDGKSFTDVLTGKTETHRDVIYTTHSGASWNVYPIRSVRSKRFKYIRNLLPDCYHSNLSDVARKQWAGAYWDSWDAAALKDPKAAAIIAKYDQRDAEEFYDLEKDPAEQNNLAIDPTYADQMKTMSIMLDEWMQQQGDQKTIFGTPYPLSGPKPHELFLQKEKNK